VTEVGKILEGVRSGAVGYGGYERTEFLRIHPAVKVIRQAKNGLL
jgi:hypothetical protein